MPRKTDGEKIDELQQLFAILNERGKNILEKIKTIGDAQLETARTVSDMQRDHEIELALLRREIDELKKWQEDQKKERDENSRRLWSFGPSLLGALVGGLITAAVAYFIGRR